MELHVNTMLTFHNISITRSQIINIVRKCIDNDYPYLNPDGKNIGKDFNR